ncbi:alpha/beta hydrolase family protein [Bacillus safensis]|uniref:alpha/beta hydrolase family protein n=1 Tax=Bacillus safensis TaxID=561879 RepID=UPI003982EA2D
MCRAGFCRLCSLLPRKPRRRRERRFCRRRSKRCVRCLSAVKTAQKSEEGPHSYLWFSRGGIMGIWTAVEMKQEAASFVTWGGVSDMKLTYEERVDMRRMMKRVIGGPPHKVPEAYENRTPLNDVDKIEAPVLIIHGEEDQNVSIEHAYLLEDALRQHGKSVETWYFHGYNHYFPPQHNREIVRRLTTWMHSRKSGNVVK